MIRSLLIALIVILIPMLGAWCVATNGNHPEEAILGEWQEVSWTYDKVDEHQKVRQHLTAAEREGIANHLVVHKYENWVFSKPYALTLIKRHERNNQIQWRLKDRGRILQLHNADGTCETYSVESLRDEELVLHFETDVHARGIVKIRLKKIRRNVGEI